MPYRITQQDEYPTWIGLIFVFNLIVGTGALTLPAVFAKAGWLLGSIVIIFLAFISYVTVTFIIETMACANAVMQWRRLQFLKRDRTLQDDEFDSDDDRNILIPNNSRVINEHSEFTTENQQRPTNTTLSSVAAAQQHTRGGGGSRLAELSDSSIEHTPLFSQQSSRYYILDKKIELGEMAGIFFNDFGRILFYLCISIYLYGDLSIYLAAISKTLRDIICSSTNLTIHNNTSDSIDYEKCWDDHTLTRLDVYRLSLIVVIMVLGPFTFFNIQKTKYIQLLTILLRWLAFIIMISIAIQRILYINNNHNKIDPNLLPKPLLMNIYGLPSLFGTCIYSFMCHHSLPSIITPIKNKYNIKYFLSIDYILIISFYLFLAITGIFAFRNLEDLYTLNFIPNSNDTDIILIIKFIEYFLILFPIFTLTASFPIISITLRNNLQTLFLDTTNLDQYNLLQRSIIFPLLTIIPPVFITYFTENLISLVSFTGTYAGTGIQYLIPITLVYLARRTCNDLLGQGIINEYRSQFRHIGWLIFVAIWSFACIILVTVNIFIT